MNKGDIHLQDLIKYFDTYNRSDGKSPSTLRWYNQTLNMLLGWLIGTGRPVTLGSFDEQVIREFILWLQERWEVCTGERYRKERDSIPGSRFRTAATKGSVMSCPMMYTPVDISK